MAFAPEIDITSAGATASQQHQQKLDEADARLRLRTLTGSFLLVLIVGLIWVWSRAPIYQSNALLQLTFPTPTNNAVRASTAKAFSISEYKLTSHNLINQIYLRLSDQAIAIDSDALPEMLVTEGDPEQGLLSLRVRGNSAEQVYPIMTHWLDIYLAENQVQQDAQSSKDLDEITNKIQILGQKVENKRSQLEEFRAKYDVASLQQEENRVLSKMKNISSALNTAEQQQIKAQSLLHSLQQARLSGQPISSPNVKSESQKLKAQILKLEQELQQFSERYTQKYMERDPLIVNKQRRLKQYQEELTSLQQSSAALYEAETQQQFLQASGQVASLAQQREELREAAGRASTKRAEYQSMVAELSYLEQQLQTQKIQLIDQEVIQSNIARIDVLEPPSTPQYPVGPHYWRDSGLVVLVALLGSLFALLVLKWVAVKRTPHSPNSTTYTVIQSPPPQAELTSPSNGQLAHHSPLGQLAQQQPRASLEQKRTPHAIPQEKPRLLSDSELSAILAHAPNDALNALYLLLSGVAPNELMTLSGQEIDLAEQLIHVPGNFERSLKMSERLCTRFQSSTDAPPLWQSPHGQDCSIEDLNVLLLIASEDADLSAPHQITLDSIRHSYLSYLAKQGCKVSSLESIAGYIAPKQLSWYRGESQEHSEQISNIHPAIL